jgi:hypothetical protein
MFRLLGSLLGAFFSFACMVCIAAAAPMEIHVSTKGDDVAGDGSKKRPYATLQAAVAARNKADPVGAEGGTIFVHDGTYFMAGPLTFPGAGEAARANQKLTIAAAPNAHPLFSGGRRLEGWKVRDGRWELEIPEVKSGKWDFVDLFVNGERRARPRLPKTGWHQIAGELPTPGNAGAKRSDRFRFRPGDLQPTWANLGDVEVFVPLVWTMNRLRIAAVENDTVRFTGNAPNLGGHKLTSGLPFIVENVREALDTPGQWYLDKSAGLLTYLPHPGEDPANIEVIAPVLDHLIHIEGTAEKPIGGITFRGLRFAHTHWQTPPQGHCYAQAEADVPAAIRLRFARNVRFEQCDLALTGGYGIDFGAGTRECVLGDCELTDLGAGGIRIGGDVSLGRPKNDDAPEVAGWNTVRNCLIAHGGRLHAAAVGVWIGHSPHNTVEQCDITDFYYTGVSLGWSWGYDPSVAHHNTVANCHIWKIGQQLLSDMGGIYTLGNGPGNVLRGNHIHDIACRPGRYGGWGLYHDEGSTGFLSENNIVHHTSSPTFHQHYGRDNTLRNNIFAFGKEGCLARSLDEKHNSFTFERNIIVTNGAPLFTGIWSQGTFRFSKNLYWDYASASPKFPFGTTFAEWREKHEAGAMLTDPHFADPQACNFHLTSDSPAIALGFHPLDPANSGRKAARRAPKAPEVSPWPAP